MAAACKFCAIVAGEAPAHLVLEAPLAIAFLDIRPVFVGHVLVVPRMHRATLPDLTPDEIAAVFGEAQRLCLAIERGLKADGTFVATNNRVSQSVPHAHVHVVPRRWKDGLRGFFWPRHAYESAAQAAETADAIARALRSLGEAGSAG